MANALTQLRLNTFINKTFLPTAAVTPCEEKSEIWHYTSLDKRSFWRCIVCAITLDGQVEHLPITSAKRQTGKRSNMKTQLLSSPLLLLMNCRKSPGRMKLAEFFMHFSRFNNIGARTLILTLGKLRFCLSQTMAGFYFAFLKSVFCIPNNT